MRDKIKKVFLIGLCFQLIYGCAVKWTEAIRYGEIANTGFSETVEIEVEKGLIFLPVTIHGKEHRFLFDSGAPFSISEQLQSEYGFKIISTGNLIDSDHNSKKVNWAQVDSVKIGDVSFLKQTAFIGDFKANPLLNCLDIDGIVGSNLMSQCNWTIDQERGSIAFFDTVDMQAFEGHTAIPFKTDYQYNIFIDVNIGQATVKNILVDYGSNGSLALSDEIFKLLKDRNIVGETFWEKGFQQAGIIGQPIILNREITFTDSISIDSIHIKKAMLRTGPTVSVGNNLLSRFQVTIDWDTKNLYLVENEEMEYKNSSPGFKLGYSTARGIYVLSVIENSNAYKEGVRHEMKVIRVDSLDFENGSDFCDYVDHEHGDTIFLQLIDSQGQIRDFNIEQTIF